MRPVPGLVTHSRLRVVPNTQTNKQMKYSADIMKKAVTIATRYAAVRRQHTVQGRDEKTGKRFAPPKKN